MTVERAARSPMRIRLVIAALAAVLAALPVRAAEKWADPFFQPPPGLLLWLDASRQKKAAEHHAGRVPQNGQAIDVCYDASGNGLHFRQRVHPARPRYLEAGKFAFLRFDGKDDFL